MSSGSFIDLFLNIDAFHVGNHLPGVFITREKGLPDVFITREKRHSGVFTDGESRLATYSSTLSLFGNRRVF
jgi:hypothetical protein